MTLVVCHARPDSRGTIMARSGDPFDRPAIRPNYLAAQSDCRALLAGISTSLYLASA
jgi:choline dehydrogenase